MHAPMVIPLPIYTVSQVLEVNVHGISRDLYNISVRRRWHSEQLRYSFHERYSLAHFNSAQRYITYLFEESFEMAKKIAETKGKSKTKAEFKGFANVELTIEEKAEMKEWIRDLDAVHLEIDEMSASGYKITFARSEAMGSYQATAFCTDTNSPNAGYILSAFAPHWLDALACLAYKHAVKCEGVWPSKDDSVGDLWG